MFTLRNVYLQHVGSNILTVLSNDNTVTLSIPFRNTGKNVNIRRWLLIMFMILFCVMRCRMWKVESHRQHICRKWSISPLLVRFSLHGFVHFESKLRGCWHLVRHLFLTPEYNRLVVESLYPRRITIYTWPILPSIDCTSDDAGNSLYDFGARNRYLSISFNSMCTSSSANATGSGDVRCTGLDYFEPKVSLLVCLTRRTERFNSSSLLIWNNCITISKT